MVGQSARDNSCVPSCEPILSCEHRWRCTRPNLHRWPDGQAAEKWRTARDENLELAAAAAVTCWCSGANAIFNGAHLHFAPLRASNDPIWHALAQGSYGATVAASLQAHSIHCHEGHGTCCFADELPHRTVPPGSSEAKCSCLGPEQEHLPGSRARALPQFITSFTCSQQAPCPQ